MLSLIKFKIMEFALQKSVTDIIKRMITPDITTYLYLFEFSWSLHYQDSLIEVAYLTVLLKGVTGLWVS